MTGISSNAPKRLNKIFRIALFIGFFFLFKDKKSRHFLDGWFSFDLGTFDLGTFDLGHLISDIQSPFSFDLQQHIHI